MGLAKIVIWKYQTNKEGESPIFIRVIEDRKARYLKTGLVCTKNDWDFKGNCFRTNYRKAEDREKIKEHEKNNEILAKKLNDANKVIKELITDDNVVSSEQVKEELVKAKSIGKLSVLTYIDQVVEDKKKIKKLGTAKCYYDLKNSIKSYLATQNKSDIVFKEVTTTFLTKYENYFIEKGASGNGISFYMRTLRSVFNKAIEENICKKEMYPFEKYKISKLSTGTKKRAISKLDIEKIKEINLKGDFQKERARDLFLFSYYCRGLNFIDMAQLKWGNIQGDRLVYIRQKTQKPYNILLLQPAIDILNKYRQLYYSEDNGYIFLVLDTNKHTSAESITNRLHKILGQTNKSLKQIGTEAKLGVPLTTYVARHSYATIMKKSGVSIAMIQEAMGHDSERTTQIYLDSFANDDLDEASKKIL